LFGKAINYSEQKAGNPCPNQLLRGLRELQRGRGSGTRSPQDVPCSCWGPQFAPCGAAHLGVSGWVLCLWRTFCPLCFHLMARGAVQNAASTSGI